MRRYGTYTQPLYNEQEGTCDMTLTIPDDIARAAESVARSQGTTVEQLLVSALRAQFASDSNARTEAAPITGQALSFDEAAARSDRKFANAYRVLAE